MSRCIYKLSRLKNETLQAKLILKELMGQAAVVQKVDSPIHWINHYPVDTYEGNQFGYPLDRDLSSG